MAAVLGIRRTSQKTENHSDKMHSGPFCIVILYNALKNHRNANRTMAHKRSLMTKKQTALHLDNFPFPFFFLSVVCLSSFYEIHFRSASKCYPFCDCAAFQFGSFSGRCNFARVSRFTLLAF